jgi:asparagine synthase (glutamine-hydrolysing)
MCGVLGFWTPPSAPADAVGLLRTMASGMRHRGPDDNGQFYDERAGLGLGHLRLSIVDLSAQGHQPMVSSSSRYVISYNGEVYNFAEIRQELEQSGLARSPFRGGSDTEVILAAVEAWGVQQAVGRFIGMFAFALWDKQEQALHLVRDRLGVKPLYYGGTSHCLLFGSELRALSAHSAFSRELDEDAIGAYVRYGYVPGPLSIYRNARKVPPGAILTFRAPSSQPSTQAQYWSAETVAASGVTSPLSGSERHLTDELESLVRDAVRLRMVADVPLGAFLSGGIDSSLVVALMQAQSSRPIRTFCIGNSTAKYDESKAAAAVAQHLGTDHTEVVINADDALAIVPDLPGIYDEPFADSSQLPTYLVSKLARRSVTVALSGDGGDELFGGYNRHVWGPRIWNVASRIPLRFRQAGRDALLAADPVQLDRLHAALGRLAPRVRHPGQQAHKIARLLGATSREACYDLLSTHWSESSNLVRNVGVRQAGRLANASSLGFAEAMMLWDLTGYLPDDIMTKVDRASMAVSLEAREPLLDHRLVEFAWRLPLATKIRDGQGKRILREVLYRHVPRELVDRPKTGFAIPLSDWLRGPLREWVGDLLAPARVARAGVFDAKAVLRLVEAHQTSTQDFSSVLWNVVMFQAWHEENATS